MSTFKHINAAQQIIDGTITSSLFAPGAVTVAALDIDGNVNFNEYQALEFRIENVSVTPTPGNVGRVIYNTTTNQFLIDNGTAFVPVSSSGAVTGIYSDSNPVLFGTIQFVSGTGISLSQNGQAITINSTAISAVWGSITGNINDQTDLQLEFSTKQDIGNYITALTGDVTASGPGSAIATLSNTGVTPGSYTNTNLTVDSKGRITVVSNGSSSGATYQQDLFQYIGSNVFTLTFTPISNSQIVLFNGLGLVRGGSYDYVVSGTTLTINAAIILKAGDQILVIYAY